MNVALLDRPARAQHLRLYDGRWATIDAYGLSRVTSDLGGHRFDFSWRNPRLSWHDSLASILIDLLSTHSLAHAEHCARYCGALVQAADSTKSGNALLLKDVVAFPTHSPLSGWPAVQSVLAKWAARRLPGLDPAIVSFLQQPERWEEKGKGEYFALVVNDPERGALTEQELVDAQNALNRMYERHEITTAAWALAWFQIATGVRPVQIARMVFDDVIVTDGPDGKEITLQIPLAKGRDASKTARWKRKCPAVLTEVLLAYLEEGDIRDPKEPLFAPQSSLIKGRLQYIFGRLDTHSDRLNRPTPLFSYRFRYTLGTRAIALGASDHVVARLLTHRTTSCIRYYRAAMPSLQKPIHDAIGEEMAYIAHAFQGRLIDSLDDATRKGDASALIRDFAHLLGQKLGACGTRAECHQDAPRACLICRKFEPFREAPWEDFLVGLIEDMSAENEARIKLITQQQIAAVREIITERDAVSGGHPA